MGYMRIMIALPPNPHPMDLFRGFHKYHLPLGEGQAEGKKSDEVIDGNSFSPYHLQA